MGICDGVIRLLRIAAITTCRDPQVSFTIDLIWTVLDAYLSQAPPAGTCVRACVNLYYSTFLQSYTPGCFICLSAYLFIPSLLTHAIPILAIITAILTVS